MVGRSGPAPAIVTPPCPVLMSPAPLRPSQNLQGVVLPVPHQAQQQFPHLRDGQRNQPPPFFRGFDWLARERMTATTASANSDNTVCRCQPVQLRTSYSSRPQSPLAISKHSSIDQRTPAIRTKSSRVVCGGPPQAQYATSAGFDRSRRISSQRAYLCGSRLLIRVTAQS